MNRFVVSVSRCLVPAVVTACWATVSLAQQGGPAGPPGGLGVNVLNTPLAVTGSTTVSGSVTVKNTADNPVPVFVGNTAEVPALTSSVDEPGRNPYQVSTTKGCGGGLGCNIDFPPVPTGKRLVVQQVSCSTTYTGQPSFVKVSVEENVTPFVRSSFFAPFAGGTILFTQRLDYYLDATNTLDIGISLGGGTSTIGQTQCSVTGHLLDCAANQCTAIVQN